jgi:haloalkane dehalogenase
VLDENQFVEEVLLSQVRDQIDDAEIAAYRAPFARAGADRLPTLAFPRQAPIGDAPPDVARAFDAFLAFMAQSPIPKLWINVEPGALIPEPLKAIPRAWKNTQEAVVRGGHFAQEQAPHGIDRAIAAFLGERG